MNHSTRRLLLYCFIHIRLRIRLSTLLNLVNRQTNFTNSFSHILGRYIKKDLNIGSIFATITACATNIGLNKMSRNTNIAAEEIYQTYRNFIRLETLKLSCDTISDSIQKLPLFSNWYIENNRLYSRTGVG